MSRIRIFIMMCSALFLSAISAHAATTYTYVTVDPRPDWKTTHLFLHGMDDLGKMVGHTIESNSGVRPWRYVPGVQPHPMMRWNYGTLPNWAYDINSRGWLVQRTDYGSVYKVNFCKPSPCVNIPLNHVEPEASKITNSGLVVGSYPVEPPQDHHTAEVGYIYDTITAKTQIVSYPGRSSTLLTGLTDDGLGTGFAFNDVSYPPEAIQEVSFTYQDGQFYPFVIPGTAGNQLISVNNRGVIVGLAFYETDILSFVQHPSGEMLEISFPDSLSTFIADVNNRGVIGGSYLRADGRWLGFVAWPQVVAEASNVAAAEMSSDAAVETSREATPDGITQEAQPLRENFRMDEALKLQVCAGAHHQYGRALKWCER